MGLERVRGSSNFIIWAILIVIALGFGKCGNIFGVNNAQPIQCFDDKKRSRKHYKEDCDCNNSIGVKNCGVGAPGVFGAPGIFGGTGGFGGLLGGNVIFIVAIIALLLLCKDDKVTPCKDTAADFENDEKIDEDEIVY